jgi:hypothetical protein
MNKLLKYSIGSRLSVIQINAVSMLGRIYQILQIKIYKINIFSSMHECETWFRILSKNVKLLIYGLINDATNKSDYKTSNDRTSK